ncbi:uncharacterized protein LOC111100914 [Crassostrea virginica]
MSVIRIIAIVLISIAIILQVAAVAADKWSEIDANYHSLPIKAFQNLWTETVLLDKPFAYPQPQNMDVEWKKDLQIIEIMCIFTGLVSLSLISAISVLSIIKQRIILAAIFRALAIIMTIVTSLMIVVGALLYNYQKVKMFSFNARNPASSYPVEEEVVSYGFLLSVVSSVLLAVSAVLEISHLVIADTRRPLPPRIQPSDDNVKEKIDDTT